MRRMLMDRSGVTNVVSLIMIIGILTSMMGMVFATYLPAWGKDLEVQTQGDVMDSFFDLRSNLDTLAVGGDTGASLSTKVRLGSNGGPLLGFGRSSGSIEFNEEMGSVAVEDQAGTIYGRGRGTVSYDSNHLYVEDEVITMEMGALIRNEIGTDILKGPPNIVVKRDINTDQTTMYLTLITIESSETSISGTQSYMVSSTLLSEEESTYSFGAGTDISVTITTDHIQLWTDVLTTIAQEEGLVLGAANDFEVLSGTDAFGNSYVSFLIHDIDVMKVRSTVFRLDVY